MANIKENAIRKKKIVAMPGPGFEPGLLRPQRRVLTTRRSRHVTTTTQSTLVKTSYIKQL